MPTILPLDPLSSIQRSTLKHPSHGEQAPFFQLVQNFSGRVLAFHGPLSFARANCCQRSRAACNSRRFFRRASREIETRRRAPRRKNQRGPLPRRTTLGARFRRAEKIRHHDHCRFARQSWTSGLGAPAGRNPGNAFHRYSGARLVRAKQRAGGAISKTLQRRSSAKNLRALLLRRRSLGSNGGRLSYCPAELDRGPGHRRNVFLRLSLPFVSGNEILRPRISGQLRRRPHLRAFTHLARAALTLSRILG